MLKSDNAVKTIQCITEKKKSPFAKEVLNKWVDDIHNSMKKKWFTHIGGR